MAARRWIAATLIGGLAWVAAPETHAAPKAVATIGMIGDVAQAVAGDCVAVETMMGPGIDPHLYQPSAGDVRALSAADLMLYAGHNLEGQLGTVLEKLAGKLAGRLTAVAVAEAAAGPDDLIILDGASYPDPHLWMDASLWARTAPVLARALGAESPDCADAITARATAYAEQLGALHGWIGETIATIPEETRILVTAHDAFAYYGRAYGLRVVGIQGVSTDSEAGVGDIRAVVDTVVEAGVPAIFIESTINPRTVEAVVAAAADRGHALTIGGELFSDAMGEAGTPGGTYIGMMYENTRAIAGALGGTPAPLPRALRPWAERWQIGG